MTHAARSTLPAGFALWLAALAAAPAAGPTSLRQDLYVWQRTWDEALKQAIRQAAPRVDGFVALAAEVAWVDGRPEVVRVPLDFPALAATGRPTGIALRVGPYPGDIDEQAAGLADLACALTSAARAGGLDPAEFQIDFDCPESRLPAFARALGEIRKRLGTLPLIATSLPCWLGKPGWREVTQACDGFVLQVHSVAAPEPGQRMTLCDPDDAKQWVARAGEAGRPFRVALPTYGYVAGFDESRRLVQLRADGSSGPLARVHSRRLVLADAVAMSSLVAGWREQRPANMVGVSWYRLPLASDRLAWTASTLDLAMRGEPLRRRVDVRADLAKDGTVNITLYNVGDVDVLTEDAGPIRVDWIADDPIGFDGLNGFRSRRLTGPRLAFNPPADAHLMLLKAGETRAVGWLRFASGQVGSVSASMGDGKP